MREKSRLRDLSHVTAKSRARARKNSQKCRAAPSFELFQSSKLDFCGGCKFYENRKISKPPRSPRFSYTKICAWKNRTSRSKIKFWPKFGQNPREGWFLPQKIAPLGQKPENPKNSGPQPQKPKNLVLAWPGPAGSPRSWRPSKFLANFGPKIGPKMGQKWTLKMPQKSRNLKISASFAPKNCASNFLAQNTQKMPKWLKNWTRS